MYHSNSAPKLYVHHEWDMQKVTNVWIILDNRERNRMEQMNLAPAHSQLAIHPALRISNLYNLFRGWIASFSGRTTPPPILCLLSTVIFPTGAETHIA